MPTELARSFRKKAEKATLLKSRLEDQMLSEFHRRRRRRPPEQWGRVYYGPDYDGYDTPQEPQEGER